MVLNYCFGFWQYPEREDNKHFGRPKLQFGRRNYQAHIQEYQHGQRPIESLKSLYWRERGLRMLETKHSRVALEGDMREATKPKNKNR